MRVTSDEKCCSSLACIRFMEVHEKNSNLLTIRHKQELSLFSGNALLISVSPRQTYLRGYSVVLKDGQLFGLSVRHKSKHNSFPWQHYQKNLCGWDYDDTHWHFLSEVPALVYAVWMFEQNKHTHGAKRVKALSLTERIWKQIFNVPHLKWLSSECLKVGECDLVFRLENNKVKWLQQGQSKNRDLHACITSRSKMLL